MGRKAKYSHELIKNDFLKSGSTVKTAKIIGCSVSSVHFVLRKYGLVTPKKGSTRKYSLNTAFFNKVDAEEKAYWLGFAYADGCVLDKGESLRFSIGLSEIDHNHLLKFQTALGSNCRLKYRPAQSYLINGKLRNSNPAWYLNISCAELCRDLVDLGCIPRKSLLLKFPTSSQVPDDLLIHFIRGYFDGDGSVFISSEKHWRSGKYSDIIHARFIGTLEMMAGICKFLNLPSCCIVKASGDKNTYHLVIKRNPRVLALYNTLYKDATVYLERKKSIFDNYFKKRHSETIITQPI